MWSITVFLTFLLVCEIKAFPRRGIPFSSDDTDELVSLFVVFRHGDRGPVYTFPNDPYSKPEYWPQGYGQLTQRGTRRQYALGQWLRERYSDFLPDIYSPKDVHVFSTDVDRTLMSASANLAGLYPPKGNQVWNDELLWQPIPVHTTSSDTDDIFPSLDDCSKYKKEYKAVKKNKHFEEINAKYANLLADLSKRTGSKLDDIRDVREVRDVIYVYENYDATYIPSWASDLDRKTMDLVTGIYFERKSFTDNLKKYHTGPFFNTLSSHFDEAVSGKTFKKLFMVSAHETSLVPILDAMGVYDFFPPDFAATIVFELRKSGSDHYIKIYYKQFDGTKELLVSDCGSKCDYKKFKSIMSKFTLDMKAWKKQCAKDDD